MVKLGSAQGLWKLRPHLRDRAWWRRGDVGRLLGQGKWSLLSWCCLRLAAGRALWWGRLGRLHAYRGRTELGDLASDEGGGLALAVSLLLAVEAAGSVVSVRVVAEGAQPEDGYELAIAIVHLGWPSMLPNERRKLALHLVGSRWCCRLGGASRLATALATLAFATSLARHQFDKDAFLRSLGLQLAQLRGDVVQLLLGLGRVLCALGAAAQVLASRCSC